MRGAFRIRAATHAADFDALRSVRDAVFVREQNVPREIELDALDAHGQPIGTARLTPDRRIGRMAVLPAWRGHHVGSALLHALLRTAHAQGWRAVSLHAQLTALAFYRRHGFVAVGEPFEEAGIAHQSMQLRLDAPVTVTLSCALVRDARRRVYLRSHDLETGLYDAPPLLDALRAFATAGRGGEVHILLHDALAAQRAHAPLLALAQRLPSVFAFREVEDPVDRDCPSALVANDAGGYFLRPLGHRFDGETEHHARARARQLSAGIDEVWERARSCSELRALSL
jgi:predicted GNAT family N-acyltransferase